MREVNRKFRDHYDKPVKVTRWERETNRVIYLGEGYPRECFSPFDQFQRKLKEVEGSHEQ